MVIYGVGMVGGLGGRGRMLVTGVLVLTGLSAMWPGLSATRPGRARAAGTAATPAVEGEGWACGTLPWAAPFEVDPAELHTTEWRARLLRTPRRLLDAYLSRPDPWMDELLPILESHDIPSRFLYLALVESGWDPEARSPKDAVGLWQLTDATARAYGLVVDSARDERTDERLATRAAGHYLRDLYDEFGSWELAAAAYNAGPGRVRRALRRSGGDDYWDLVRGEYLPSETRAYVPRFLAVVRLAAERTRGSSVQHGD